MLAIALIGLVGLMPIALGGPDLMVQSGVLSLKPVGQSGPELVITADVTRFDLAEGRGWFEGSVQASRGDIQLSADKAEVVIGEATEQAVILGTVVVTQGEYRATGDKAVFDGDVLVLTGSPVLTSPRHKMVGERMVFCVGARTVECAACTITVKPSP